MPIDVRGTTQVVSGVSVVPGANKTVYVVAERGTDPTGSELIPFDITSSNGASESFGDGAVAVDLVETLITNGATNIRGIIVPEFTNQAEEATIAGAVSGSGNATVIVTAAGMTGSPITLSVAVLENDTAAQVAGKIRTALGLNDNITGFFTVSGTDTKVKLTKKTYAATDATLNISVANGTCSGITQDLTSDDVAETISTAYDSALDAILMDGKDTYVIVVDKTDAAVFTKLKTHLDLAEAENMFGYAVIGTVAGASNSTLTTLADSINHKRMYLAGPSVLNDSGVAISGIYAAAGLAAVISSKTADPALPCNGIEILGFGGSERMLLKADKEALVAGGVTPLYQSPAGNPTVYRLVSTYTKDTQGDADGTWQELTTVMIADNVLTAVRNRILANYKRTKNATRVLDSIRTDVIDVLRIKNDPLVEIIENFDESKVLVRKDPDNVYGALVSYEIDVVTPLYVVTITQNLKV